MHRTVFFALICSIMPAQLEAQQPSSAPMRLWVSRDGQYLQARPVRVSEGLVYLEDAAGQRSEIRLSELSIEDQKYAQGFSKQQSGVLPQPRRPESGPRSVLKPAYGDSLLPPPRPEPELANQPSEDRGADALDQPTAAKKTKLPKAIRTLQRLLKASGSGGEGKGSPLFGTDSSIYIEFSAKFLNEFIQVPIDQNQPVEEMIMGMPVAGNADMHGMASMALIPNPDHAAFEVIVQGRADSTTSGGQMLVNVQSEGTSWFKARKRIEIGSDGFDLYEASAEAKTTINQAAVSTEIPGRIGSLVGRIVGRVVEANRPQIDYEASEKAAYRAAKELDGRIDREVVRVQQILGEIAPGLKNGNPMLPIRFQTAEDRVAILIGEYEPDEWKQFGGLELADNQDITVVLPKRTVSTAKQLQMAMRLLSISIEDQLGGVKPEELQPTTQTWSDDKEWLTLTWDVKPTIVELLSKDFIDATQPAAAAQSQAATTYQQQPTPRYRDVPSWNQGGTSFRPRP